MNVIVKFNEKYAEVTIKSGNATIETGLLSKEEMIEIASELNDAASLLIEHADQWPR